MKYEIITRDSYGNWISDGVGEPNVFDTIADAEEAIAQLRKLGDDDPEWAAAEYRVRERAE